MNIDEFKTKISSLAIAKEAFLFVIDFECKKPFVCPLNQVKQNDIIYDINGLSNIVAQTMNKKVTLQTKVIGEDCFIRKAEKVIQHIKDGDSYLLNLTFPSSITTKLSLEELFHIAKAPYKLKFKDEFVCFSPECFIKIIGQEVFTYPMKGTIDASIKDAEKVLLNNLKEEWEHNTIVDLMRNDIAMIAQNVVVSKYRYIDKIKTHKNEILQTSSEVKGQLHADWRKNLGELIMKLLPAGSISGAPKQKTVEIIQKIEIIPRGYYTGVFGIFDGENLYSAIAIRFIEKKNGNIFFRSGGGITAQSNISHEYQELIQKIYVPTF